MTTDSKTTWQVGLPNELEHWKWWLTSGPEAFANESFNDYEWRTDPNSDVRDQPHLTRYLEPFAPAGSKVTILDVGAGPLTCVGKKWPDRTVEITPVDPLAPEYNALLDELNLTPLVRTQPGEVERLSELFPSNHFDLVYCQNALDHVYDPVRGIREMLEVVQPHHAVVLMHNVNEGEREHYFGLHQWNFCREQDDFVIWSADRRVRVNEEMAGIAEVRFEETHSPNLLITSLIKKG
jgi:SAM-dependent methyltransferase